MNKSKILKRINNLNKLKQVIEIAKFDTFQKISKIQKVKNHHYKIAEISQKIVNFSKTKNKWSNLIHNKIFIQNHKTLWIYITMNTIAIKDSYKKYNQFLDEHININTDSIIAIGEPAIKYAMSRKIKIVYKHQKISNNYLDVSILVTNAITNLEYGKIFIVAEASKTKNQPFKIFPFENIDYDQTKMRKTKFFYSLSDTIENISYTYVSNIIIGIYKESFNLFYKERLIRHIEALESIDKKLNDLKKALNKNIRDKNSENLFHTKQVIWDKEI